MLPLSNSRRFQAQIIYCILSLLFRYSRPTLYAYEAFFQYFRVSLYIYITIKRVFFILTKNGWSNVQQMSLTRLISLRIASYLNNTYCFMVHILKTQHNQAAKVISALMLFSYYIYTYTVTKL